jgi:uncharacterized protein (TIGR02145 family)
MLTVKQRGWFAIGLTVLLLAGCSSNSEDGSPQTNGAGSSQGGANASSQNTGDGSTQDNNNQESSQGNSDSNSGNSTNENNSNGGASQSSGNETQSTNTIHMDTSNTANSIALTITHNGTTYGTVISPYTGKTWLDRNLGAAEVCTGKNDVACYGDYYQWGRNSDGHEDSGSGTTDTRAANIENVGHGNFIVSGNSDWAASGIDNDGAARQANWSKTDGSSVCPTGFRVPTTDELSAETTEQGNTNSTSIFNSFLKLPTSGYRNQSSGEMELQDSDGFCWSSSASSTTAGFLGFGSNSADASSHTVRSMGLPVRCIKD